MNRQKTRQLGIFQGKKALYNELILRSLTSGKKTTKQIALYIVAKAPKKGKGEDRNYKHVYSNIIRSEGRLAELQELQYIKRKNLIYSLTFKGMAVSLTLQNNLDEAIIHIKRELENLNLEDETQKLARAIVTSRLLPSFIKPKPLLDCLIDLLVSTEFYSYIKKATEEFIKKGVDVDSMTDEEFRNLIIINSFEDVVKKKFLATLTDILDEQLKTE